MKILLTRLLLVLGMAGALAAALWWQQRQLHHARGERDRANAQVAALNAELALERGKERIVTRYVDRVQTVRAAARTIEKRIPVYVTVEADRRCPVPVGFVRVHDAAAQGLPLGEPAGDPDAPAAGVALSAVADTVAGNYETCHEVRENLIALQDYVRSLQGATADQPR